MSKCNILPYHLQDFNKTLQVLGMSQGHIYPIYLPSFLGINSHIFVSYYHHACFYTFTHFYLQTICVGIFSKFTYYAVCILEYILQHFMLRFVHIRQSWFSDFNFCVEFLPSYKSDKNLFVHFSFHATIAVYVALCTCLEIVPMSGP